MTNQAVAGRTVAIGYVRVSREEQASSGSLSLETQRAAIQDYCQRRGWALSGISEDHRSGKDLKRGGVQQVLTAAREGRADVVTVFRLDRLTRSVQDWANVVAVLHKHGLRFASTTEGFDTTTPEGELMGNLLASFAQHERRIISARQKAQVTHRQRNGVFVGRCPYGWRSTRRRHGDPAKWQPVPEEQATIVDIRDRRRRGWSSRRIAADLNSRGIPGPSRQNGWDHTAVRRLIEREPPNGAPMAPAARNGRGAPHAK